MVAGFRIEEVLDRVEVGRDENFSRSMLGRCDCLG